MKAWAIVGPSNSTNLSEYDFENFKLLSFDVPVPKKNEIVIQIKAISLNPVDYKMMSEAAKRHDSYPWIPGVDCAGEVFTKGDGVENLVVGDRVMVHDNINKRYNGFAEFVCIPSHVASKIHPKVSFEEAAGIPCAGMTSYQALIRKLRIEKGKSILIHCGSGGTGSFGIQYAKAVGLTVFTTCSGKNFKFVQGLGADFPLDYRGGSDMVNQQIKDLTDGKGVDYAFNTLSPSSATKDLEILKYSGSLVTICGRPDYSKLPGVFTKCLSLHEVGLGCCYSDGDEEDQSDLAKMGEDIIELMVAGKVKTVISEVFEFGDLKKAIMKLIKRDVKPGKVIIKM